MGLFTNYSKPGPGVDVNAPKKKGLFLYLEVLGRKFFPLIKVNCLYVLASLPFFAIALFVLAPLLTDAFVGYSLAGDTQSQQRVMFALLFAGLIFTFYGSGPAASSYSFVTRSFTRSEPLYGGLLSDSWDKFKENFKYAMLYVIMDIVVIYIVISAIRFYAMGGTLLSLALYFFCVLIFAVFSISHMFAYQIMVTFDCKFKDIIKNSIILTIAKLPMCILLGVISTVICSVFCSLGLFGIIIYAVVGMSIAKFSLEFYAARVIDKNIESMSSSEGGN